MTDAPKPYRPAVRGLVFGLVAIGLRAVAFAVVLLIMRAPAGSSLPSVLGAALEALPVLNLIATLVALVGVGYSAIAAHRDEGGVVLVIAFVCSVAGVVLDVQPFLYF